jgi:hypothetical protein
MKQGLRPRRARMQGMLCSTGFAETPRRTLPARNRPSYRPHVHTGPIGFYA